MAKALITNSRATSFKKCRRRHLFEYELCLRPQTEGKAIRLGSAVHVGLDRLKQGMDLDGALEAVSLEYAGIVPDADATFDLMYEEMTALCMVSGWAWRWGGHGGLDVVASEESFQVDLRNPATGSASHLFDLAGKIDGIVNLGGRGAVLEHKTVSEDLSESSGYWSRLQMDAQISLYVYAARVLGHDVHGVLYDCLRKPTIRPEAVPILDENGTKVVLDAEGRRVRTKDGKKWRETGSAADGYTLQSRPMTPEEWGQKLTADIADRPDYYFARREVARLDSEIEDALAELWELQQTLREAQLRSRWYRTVSRDTCPYCPFFSLCSSKYDPDGPVPGGFVRVENPHQELE